MRILRLSLASASLCVAAFAVLPACGASARRGDLEPRYVALHNAFAAMGLSEVGPLQQGSLAEGREVRVPLELAAQCTTVVALGAEGVRDLDVSLLDPGGKPVAHDTTREPQAVVRVCVELGGTYTLIVKMAAGSGDFVTAMWGGGLSSAGSAGALASAAAGTCESPILLGAGSLNASTARGESANEGSCAESRARELVYRLEVPARQRFTVEVDPHFDAVIYLRKGDCAGGDEIICNDDQHGQRSSKIDEVLDPGTYFLFVDGVSNESGAFRMSVAVADAPTLVEVCRLARPLGFGPPVNGATGSSYDHARASCGEGAKGPDTVYKLDVAQRSRVRLVEHSDDFGPVLHLRKQCADEQSEVGCADSGSGDGDASLVGSVEPGAYAVFADASDHEADGRFTLTSEIAAEQGTGVQGDGCADAIALHGSTVAGDTFLAHDDVAGRCGGAGAADVIYRLEVAKRARISAQMGTEEGKHLFVLSRSCGDKASEVTCGDAVDEVLNAGTYYLAVDGATPDGLGKFEFAWKLQELAAQESACRGATTLRAGQTLSATTSGAGDKFSPSCNGRDVGASDRVYRLVLASRARVHLTVAASGWDALVAVVSSCVEGTSASRRASSVACASDADAHRTELDTVLDAGTYFVVVDGVNGGSEGAFTLDYRAEAVH